MSLAGQVKGDVLANTTSIGMHPQQDVSPVAASALKEFELVFDAVYTPMDTQLLQVSLAYTDQMFAPAALAVCGSPTAEHLAQSICQHWCQPVLTVDELPLVFRQSA